MPSKLTKALEASARKKGYIPGSKKFDSYVYGIEDKIKKKIRKKNKGGGRTTMIGVRM